MPEFDARYEKWKANYKFQLINKDRKRKTSKFKVNGTVSFYVTLPNEQVADYQKTFDELFGSFAEGVKQLGFTNRKGRGAPISIEEVLKKGRAVLEREF